MNLLLGATGGASETAGVGTAGTALLNARSNLGPGGSNNKRQEGVDIASLSTAETAALLQQQQQQQKVKTTTAQSKISTA